jgi:hypothetical protein
MDVPGKRPTKTPARNLQENLQIDLTVAELVSIMLGSADRAGDRRLEGRSLKFEV